MVAYPQCAEAGAIVEELQARGSTVVRVQGRSMYPYLRNQARVVVEPVAYDELRLGDLVVFTNGRSIYCHRLIKKAHHLCYVKGDTNLSADPPIIWSFVLGRVTQVVRTEENQIKLHSIDSPRHWRRAALLARCSYIYALYYNLMHAIGRCRWWARGIEWD
jgi:signal peptidase I